VNHQLAATGPGDQARCVQAQCPGETEATVLRPYPQWLDSRDTCRRVEPGYAAAGQGAIRRFGHNMQVKAVRPGALDSRQSGGLE
jgi:hypothetical protein